MAAILTSDLTTKIVDGTGVFDCLMSAMKANLAAEYEKTRISGADYAKVYLGALEATMSQSIQFLLGQQTADKQAELIAAQVTNEVLKGTLLQSEIDKIAAEILLINAQKLKVDQDVLIGIEQAAKLVKETLLVIEQTAKTTQDISLSQTQQANLVLEQDKTIAETALIVQQKANAVLQASLLTNQALKVTEEKNLLKQKVLTEEAQIVDRVTGALADVTGVIGKQKLLYTAQQEGFDRDAEQKLLKIITDGWSVKTSVDPTNISLPYQLDDTSLGEIIDKARVGIAMAAATDPTP